MNHLRSEIFGIDVDIQEIQNLLYSKLNDKYGNFLGFGRVYKNERENGVIPEVYDSQTEDYKEVMFDDTKTGVMFFIDDDNHSTDDEVIFTTDLKICFMVDLSKTSLSTDRSDSEIQTEVVRIIRDNLYVDFDVEEIQKGKDNVLNGFDTSQLIKNDMHPLHIFSIKGTLNYSINNKC